VTHAVKLLSLTVFSTLALTGCGGGETKQAESSLNKDVQAVCDGSPLSTTPKLPPSFPQIEADKLTYTKESSLGPTEVVEGYFHGDVTEAHDEFEKELKASGYTILFNELEAPHDSEISWKGEGRTGQVAMRAECSDTGKTYVHVTNRPA
jgi:hypothetical protein